MLEGLEVETGSPGISFLAKLAIALGIAATISLISVCTKWSPSGSSYSLPVLIGSSSLSVPAATPVGFNLTIFGYNIIIPEYTPGWVYFWLLMAAGCGLFISEEALNIWVGISLARTLTLDSNWQAFTASFSKNAPYIVSTVLWVYWGVCISDMIPYYLGQTFRKTKASEDICTKLGIGKDRAERITRGVQKYGNLIGFGHIFGLLFCWRLLWRSDHSFNSAGDWVLAERAASDGTCQRCNSCGHLDCIPISIRGFDSNVSVHPAMATKSVIG